MAAHDDKISENRRRLFKALSVAPVVYTVDSGAQQAMSSVYQCATKIAVDGTEPDLELFGPAGVTEHFLFSDLQTYWPDRDDPTNVFFVTDGTFIYRGNSTGVTVTKAPLYVGVGDPLDGAFKIADGRNTDPSTEGDKVFVWRGNVTNPRWVRVSESKETDGKFAVLGHVDNQNRQFVDAGHYPIVQEQDGLQGMTGTCLCSIDPNHKLCANG